MGEGQRAEVFDRIDKIMLPGDYIAMKLTDRVCTTVSGLSEGMFWDFKNGRIADFLMEYLGFSSSIIPEIVPTFSVQGQVTAHAAAELGLAEGTRCATVRRPAQQRFVA